MMLTEVMRVPDALLPVQAMKEHLRLGSGFDDDGMQDALIAAHLRAAMATIEGRTGKALLARQFQIVLDDWREGRSGYALPIAPVSEVQSVVVNDASGSTVLNASSWRLVKDLSRPRLVGNAALPTIPEGGSVTISLMAGFGPDWADVPADLAQAVFLLAAEFYELRHDGGRGGAALPKTVQALIERWRTVRILGGGGA